MFDYTYECNGQIKDLQDDQETKVEVCRLFVVKCEDCCNVPVYHLLERKKS